MISTITQVALIFLILTGTIGAINDSYANDMRIIMGIVAVLGLFGYTLIRFTL